MRYVAALEEEEKAELRRLHREAPTHRQRQRAHALLLSARGYCVEELAEIFESDRDAVARWLDHWEGRTAGRKLLEALSDAPKSGRPPKLSAEDRQDLLARAREGCPNLKAEALEALKKKGSRFAGRH
jgi:transposase